MCGALVRGLRDALLVPVFVGVDISFSLRVGSSTVSWLWPDGHGSADERDED